MLNIVIFLLVADILASLELKLKPHNNYYENMHWEKIPLTDEDGKLGTRMVKEQLEDLSKQGIPYRFVRTKEEDGTETLSIEKQID
jgi:hypothetical protein